MGFPELATQYQIYIDRPDALDTFMVKVELTEQDSQNVQLDLKAIKCKIQSKICSITGLHPDIEIVKYGEIPRTEGKAKHVFDNRKGKT
jgi:phenylacetate-CoA ligase